MTLVERLLAGIESYTDTGLVATQAGTIRAAAAEIERLEKTLETAREDAIEAAAKVADRFTCGLCGMDGKAAAAIRALLQKKEG